MIHPANHSSCFDNVDYEPVDKAAAMLMAKGVKVEQTGGVAWCQKYWEICPQLRKPTWNEQNFTGNRFGRLTAVGLLQGTNKAVWVCRCDCGLFVHRKPRAIINPENFGDRCHKCRHLAAMRRRYEFFKHGLEVDDRTL